MEVDQEAATSEENDEALVLVQFTGIGIDELLNSDPPPEFKAIGIGESETIIQIGPHLYSGKVENSHTTNLFFKNSEFDEEKENDEFDVDLQNIPEKWVTYEGKSCKVLKVRRIFPKERAGLAESEIITGETLEQLNISGNDGQNLDEDVESENIASDIPS